MTIAKKLGFGFGLVIALMVLAAFVAYVKVATMNDSVKQVVEDSYPTIEVCGRVRNSVTRQVSSLRGYLLLGGEEENARTFKAARTDRLAAIDRAVQELKDVTRDWSEQDRGLVEKLVEVLAAFRDSERRIEEVAHTDANVPSLTLMRTTATPLADEMRAIMTELVGEETSLVPSAERMQLIAALAQSRLAAINSLGNLSEYLLAADPRCRDGFEKSWAQNQEAFDEGEKTRNLLSGPRTARWVRYGKLRNEFVNVAQQIFALRDADDWNKANYLVAHEALPQINEIESLLGQIVKVAENNMNLKMHELDEASQALVLALVLSTGAALTLSAIGALIISRRMISTTRRLADRIRQISQGDLTGEALLIKSADELGELASGFDTMLASLRDLTGQILSVTESVNSATTQISASTTEQAASMQQQASTVQEITRTMQEISQSGAQIVEKAKDVAAAAEATVKTSQAGTAAVQTTSGTMQAIREQVEEVAENIVALSEKTQAVGEVIATVTDVAEQSNLLALNASIEAAHAGDEGSRFAVVASEMKNLADQAKQCTVQVRKILGEIQKGINTAVMLTEEAVKRVETGKQQADLSEQAIRQLSENTVQSVQAFQQIIAATNQQQVGFDQVTKGMKDIDQATQQTATGTVQLEQAVVSLSALSQQLKRAVAIYRV